MGVLLVSLEGTQKHERLGDRGAQSHREWSMGKAVPEGTRVLLASGPQPKKEAVATVPAPISPAVPCFHVHC